MHRAMTRLCLLLLLATALLGSAGAQTALTWQEVRAKFEAANPTLQAGQIGIDESKAQEITAYLRPNPTGELIADQIDPFNGGPPHGTFAYLLAVGSVSYLHERQHKRELRLTSAQDATKIAVSSQADLERTLLFDLRMAFVQALQGKAVFNLAKENLDYYDHLLGVNRERYKLGDIAQVDLDRLELQRVQYESDLQTADVNLRTAKIQLLALLNDRTPVDQFDVTGPFDFAEQLPLLDDVRQTAVDTRPDLKAALQSVDKAKTDHRLAVANGSTDPTFGFDVGRNPPIDQYIGFDVSIPLRIFDRNQGEKLRTATGHRPQRKADGGHAGFSVQRCGLGVRHGEQHSDASATLQRALPEAGRASPRHDCVFLRAWSGIAARLAECPSGLPQRATELPESGGFVLEAANQLNLAVGREVLP